MGGRLFQEWAADFSERKHPNTIETYLGKIRQKLNLENNRELIRHAIA
jgi:DNA-binding CsgD family transcriptional regulator